MLEASAGTGKTHAVASLVVAEVARGRPISEMLVVTFTNQATGTLRERVWLRLRAAATGLATGADDGTDPLLTHLLGDPASVARYKLNIEQALTDYDTANIATTHGFCQQVLGELGVAGDAEQGLTLVEDVSQLISEAVEDLWVRRTARGDAIGLELTEARVLAKIVMANPDAEVAGVDPDRDDERLRRRFAVTLRRRIERQKREQRLISYDDVLARLCRSIDDPDRGHIVIDQLRSRFTMTIVDEFQDTDPTQWRIFEAAFAAPPHRLVVVGDPKQAIYSFRGGDVHTYLDAIDGAGTTRSLRTSWRADQPLLDGLDAYFDGAQLGDPAITHHPLRCRPGAEQSGLIGAAAGPPFTVRILDRASGAFEVTSSTGVAARASTRRAIATDLAAEVVHLLTSGVTLGANGPPLAPGDISVLVRAHSEFEAIRQALVTAGVPAVVHQSAGVMGTEAPRDWLDLLKALETPALTGRMRVAALGPFIGWPASRLAIGTDEDWDGLDEAVREWGAALRSHGVSGLLRAIESNRSFTARMLGVLGGERKLSDLRHVGELLHAQQTARPGSIAMLVTWLTEQIGTEGRDELDHSRRRLESDADAVTIQTIHGAKGLEFPVVLLPSLWESVTPRNEEPVVFHDEQGRRLVSVGGTSPIQEAQRTDAQQEQDAEALRLLYVALTRARHRVVAWWATGHEAARSPFARVLLGRDPGSGEVAQCLHQEPDEESIRRALVALSARTGGQIAFEDVGDPKPPGRVVLERASDSELATARFDRHFDGSWVRTSYSGLTAAAHDASAAPTARLEAADVGDALEVDEPDPELTDRAPEGHPLAVVVPLSDVPGGSRMGNLVHEALEVIDFTASNLAGDLRAALVERGGERLVPDHLDVLVEGLVAALSTPMGLAFRDRPLRSIGRRDRLDELGFDLPIAGGDDPRGAVTMDAIADVFASRLPAGDPLSDYHERLRDPLLAAKFRGFLNGSIDLVTRIGDRHVVIDYKTNHLGPRGEPLLLWHYRPSALAVAMADAHYPLQAALYSVALHRYLRWRLPHYDPAAHLGGVAYLYLRGMVGPEAPCDGDGRPCGVFEWQPGPEFVLALSDLFDRGAP